jgi:hypothetical protein
MVALAGPDLKIRAEHPGPAAIGSAVRSPGPELIYGITVGRRRTYDTGARYDTGPRYDTGDPNRRL